MLRFVLVIQKIILLSPGERLELCALNVTFSSIKKTSTKPEANKEQDVWKLRKSERWNYVRVIIEE